MKDKFVGIAKVGEKGQIVIPKEARDMFDIKPGDTVVVFPAPLVPKSANNSPCLIFKSIPFTAILSLNFLVNFFVSIEYILFIIWHYFVHSIF